MFNFSNGDVVNTKLYIYYGGTLAIALVLYVFRSIALFTMANKSKDSKINNIAYMAWIPCIWVYLAGKLAGRVNFFGNEIKSFALIAVIVVTVAEVSSLAYNILENFALIRCLLSGKEVVYVVEDNTSVLMTGNSYVLNSYSQGVENFITALSTASSLFDLLSEVLLLFIYIAFFKKYWTMHYTAGTILSLFGFFPIIAFIVRNKQPVDFEKYMQERYQKMYGNFYNRPNNPNNFNNQNNFNNEFNNQNNSQYNSQNNAEPFEDFNSNGESKDYQNSYQNVSSGSNSSKDDDNPFPEFDNKN